MSVIVSNCLKRMNSFNWPEYVCGYINIAEDNLCEIILVYLLFIYCLIFQLIVLLNAYSLYFTIQIQVTYENIYISTLFRQLAAQHTSTNTNANSKNYK